MAKQPILWSDQEYRSVMSCAAGYVRDQGMSREEAVRRAQVNILPAKRHRAVEKSYRLVKELRAYEMGVRTGRNLEEMKAGSLAERIWKQMQPRLVAEIQSMLDKS